MTNYTTLSDSELTEALNFHRRQRNMSRGINEAAHARQTQMVRMLEAEEARRLNEEKPNKYVIYKHKGKYGVSQDVGTGYNWDHSYHHGYHDTVDAAKAWAAKHAGKYPHNVTVKEEVELDEQIKGWKHAASDISKMRAAQGKNVKLVSLKKDGTESKMNVATKMFRSEDEAQEHHDRVTKLNPKSKIRHNLYVDGKHVKTLGEEVELDEEFGDYSSKKTSEKKSTSAHPDGKPIHRILHKGEVVGTIEPYSAYREKRRPGSRIVSSRTNVTKYSVHFHADKGPTKSADIPLYHKLGHANVQSALKSAADVHSDWLKKSALKEEIEQLDEVSASTLRNYIDKSRADKKAAMKDRTAAEKNIKQYGMASDKKERDDAARRVVNRNQGISVANKKLGTYPADKAKAKVMAREEVDLDEGIKDTFKSIKKHAANLGDKFVQGALHGATFGMMGHDTHDPLTGDAYDKVKPFSNKLKKKMKEEVEQIDEISTELKKRYVEKGAEDVVDRFTGRGKYERPRNPAHFTKTGRPKKSALNRPEAIKYREKLDNRREIVNKVSQEVHGKKRFGEEFEINEASDLRITKIYNKWPKKATYAVHTPDRKYFKEFDSMEDAKAHHAKKTSK